MTTTIVPTEVMVSRLRRLVAPRRLEQRSDHDLVAGAADGDTRAFSELYDRHGALAYGVALRVTRDVASAQDAVQEAFVQLWLGASRVDPGRTSVAAWIVLLARRRAIDLARRETRAARTLSTPLHDLETPAAEVHALVRIESERARAALCTLTPDQRAVIELAYYRGLSQSEIACALEIPTGTVKSRTRTALAVLRVALAGA